jgi:hypothetical protein
LAFRDEDVASNSLEGHKVHISFISSTGTPGSAPRHVETAASLGRSPDGFILKMELKASQTSRREFELPDATPVRRAFTSFYNGDNVLTSQLTIRKQPVRRTPIVLSL